MPAKKELILGYLAENLQKKPSSTVIFVLILP